MLTVFVSRSAGILDSMLLDTVALEGASVNVLRDGQVWQTLPGEGGGFYRLHLGQALGSEPHTYTLQVSAPGYPAAEASQVMPEPVIIEEVKYTPEGGINSDGNKVNTIDIVFRDPAGVENYYLIDGIATYFDSLAGEYSYS
ncbi:DUF4249 family protein, partial [Arthrospira platensis SPKY1]|nr:DUF4249 family protein [Arthrospira platensis SPKY1]